MWYLKWLMLLVYVITHCDSALLFGKDKGRGDAISRLRYHQESALHLPPHRRHAQPHLEANAQHNRISYKLRHHANAAKRDKFPQLKEINKRLDKIAQRDSPKMRTKKYHWPGSYGAKAPAQPAEDTPEDEDDDEDGEDDDYIDEIGTASEATNYEEEEVDDGDEGDYKDEIVEEDGLMVHDVQAEQSVREQSPMTQYKWDNYGTRARVEKIVRHEHGSDTDQMHMMESAFRHRQRVQAHGKCREPRAKLVNVQQVHPSAGTTFRPHCTILHRCADDTGCCPEAHTRCRPKQQELVHLYFFTMSINPPMSSVRKLPFYNHTECGCLAEDAQPEHLLQTARLIRSKSNHYNDLQPDTPHSCKCPDEFVAASGNGRKCGCDCPASSEPLSGCMNMKRGREHFSLKSRKCIAEERCGMPRCDFGAYVKAKGRCPRKEECGAACGASSRIGSGSRAHLDEEDAR